MDDPLMSLVRDFSWAPTLGLVAWAWKRNEKEHDDMRAAALKAEASTQTLGSHLNDRLTDHIDEQVKDVRVFAVAEDAKLMAELGVQRGHIDKIFDKLEAHGQRSEDRHIETMNAIHTLATTMHQALAQKADR
jgi:hypothetical protein